MKTLGILLGLLFCSAACFAECVDRPCELISLKVSSSEYITYTNERFAKDKSYKPDSISGIRLFGNVTRQISVPCNANSPISKSSMKVRKGTQSFFYITKDSSVSKSFIGKTTKMFLSLNCCDMPPPMGECMVQDEILRGVPDFLKSKK